VESSEGMGAGDLACAAVSAARFGVPPGANRYIAPGRSRQYNPRRADRLHRDRAANFWFGTRVALQYSEEFMKTMKGTGLTPAAIALAIGLVMLAAPNKIEAQQTKNDRFDITLSYPVTIGGKVLQLQPGNYSVEPLTITGGTLRFC
jgi:hypothetical protein